MNEPRPPRVFGIDWLEMFVSEAPSVDYSAEGFEHRGWWVERRDYGTKTMAEMFTLCDKRGYPFIEIRRAPRGLQKHPDSCVYTFGDSYVRLCNLYCYDENPMRLMLSFLEREKYRIKKIYRIDLYMDIVRFDSGDIPKKVARRIVNHTYAKVNQTNRRTSGADTWTECFDDWISWGAMGSMVSTKFYNKTKEIEDTGMKKTYILENWRRCGLIDDVTTIRKNGEKVEVWRLEFSIKGNAKGWIWINAKESEDGARHMIPHSPECYIEKQGVLNALVNLIPYYFKFRKYREGVKKSNCEEKVLFKFDDNEAEQGYRLTSASDAARVRHIEVNDELTALHLLDRAYKRLSGTEVAPDLQKIIGKVFNRVSERARHTFQKDTDVF